MAISTRTLPARDLAFADFLTRYPAYAGTRRIDELRASEYARLDRDGHVYLDYTAGSLYADGQIRRHAEMLLGRVLGNPHSSNPTSLESTERVERCRRRVLDFFHAPADEYEVVFTANASQALKLVGESYPFGPGDRFLLTFDNHNSVNGIREFDRVRGAITTYVPSRPPEMRIADADVERALELAEPGRHNLFAYPAQSNFSGVQHPLDWVARAKARGWDVLLDAASFVPTNRLDLARVRPDFVALSFYKIFGFPTGIGALVARREALAKLHRPWFAGGTIHVASVQADRHVLAAGAAGFEDGTIDYLNIPSVEDGFAHVESIGIDTIHERVSCLAGWLIAELLELKHGNGAPLMRLFGPRSTDRRGGTLAFNFHDAAGRVIDHQEVERRANTRRISLRTGCFCNPGAGELALGLSRHEIETCFLTEPQGITYDDFRRCIDPKSGGAVRVSLGIASNFADVHAFVEFAKEFLT
jgi:selenocysteine lyase/cysteine desulfurase